MKFVINKCYGGFGLSDDAYIWLAEVKGWKIRDHANGNFYHQDQEQWRKEGFMLYRYPSSSRLCSGIGYLGNERGLDFRSNPDVVECVETLKEKSFGFCAKLRVIEGPDTLDGIEIHEYDGMENLQTIPNTWG